MKLLGNLLLVLGTAFAGIGAANTERASRAVPLADATGEFAFDNYRTGEGTTLEKGTEFTAAHIATLRAAGIAKVTVQADAAAQPGEAIGRVLAADVVAPAKILVARGDELTAETVAQLQAENLDRVTVKVPPRDKEKLSLADAAGRVLNQAVKVGTAKASFKAGRTVTEKLLQRLWQDAASIQVRHDDGSTTTLAAAIAKLPAPATETLSLDKDEADDETKPPPFDKLPHLELVSKVEIDDDEKLPKGRFLDESAIAKLKAHGVQEVEVKISRKFGFAGWGLSWMFFLGIVVMGVGVFFSRWAAKPAVSAEAGADTTTPEGMRSWLVEMTTAVDALAAEVDTLECEQIHQKLDPLFVQYGQPFVEHRNVLRAAYGGAGFAHIMGPFASAERRLNRSWSAAVDGYLEEAREQVKAAGPYLREALEAFPH